MAPLTNDTPRSSARKRNQVTSASISFTLDFFFQLNIDLSEIDMGTIIEIVSAHTSIAWGVNIMSSWSAGVVQGEWGERWAGLNKWWSTAGGYNVIILWPADTLPGKEKKAEGPGRWNACETGPASHWQKFYKCSLGKFWSKSNGLSTLSSPRRAPKRLILEVKLNVSFAPPRFLPKWPNWPPLFRIDLPCLEVAFVLFVATETWI